MKIALVGYGKMGKEIESLCLSRGHEISVISDSHRPLMAENLAGTDVAIEFTRPDSAAGNILRCFEAGVPVVCGTTGWYNRLPEIRQEALNSGGTLLYASNFSIGVNVVFHLNRMLAGIMDRFPEYSASVHEIHHVHKLDKPSGTAITLAEGILGENKKYETWSDTPDDKVLAVTSERTDEVPGTHIINWQSEVDLISLRHEAFSRQGFALGAVHGAEWLHGKKGVYSIHDFLKF
ncbi:MAG: hypothetical protein RL220_652 [Bacteroidota bacterium]